MSEVASFYDAFSKVQSNSGVHKRHLLILEWLKYYGLKKNHNVLEIGAGVGTVTGLLANYLQKGSLTANDISQKSIEIAKKRLHKFNNIFYSVGDITKIQFDNKYNAIVLPDVIEHIPKELHLNLFKCLHSILEDDGFIAVHIPNPYYLEWVSKHRPEELQVIDQPLHLDFIGEVIHKSEFYISHMQTYAIWNDKADYQILQLRKSELVNHFTLIPNETRNFLSRVVKKLKRMLGLGIYKLPV